MLIVELSLKLQKELQFPLARVNYWTDSTIVLRYLKNPNLRFKRFVENKVAFIKNFSNDNWYYVPSKSNPADLVSRGAKVSVLSSSKLWNHGPEFLITGALPEQSFSTCLDPNDEEVKSGNLVLSTNTEINTFDRLFESTSCWYKLKKLVAYLLKFKEYLKTKNISKISISDLRYAENEILKIVQRKFFKGDMESVERGHGLVRGSN